MKIIAQHNKPGPLGIIGLPFFLGGFLFLYAILDPSTHWTGQRPPLYIGLPFCSVFIFIGAIFLFGRSGYILDPFRRKGHTYWGLLIPFVKKEFSFSKIDHLHISQEARNNKNSSYIVYPIKLIMIDSDPIDLDTENRDYLIAREKAERIARECTLSFKNSNENDEILSPDRIDKSFCDKIDDSLSLPIGPFKTNLKIEDILDTAIIKSNYETPFLSQLIPALITVIMTFPFYIALFSVFKDAKESIIFFAFIAFSLIPGLIVLINSLYKWNSQFEVLIRTNDIVIKTKGIISKKKRIDISSILDINLNLSSTQRPFASIIKSFNGINGHWISIISENSNTKVYPFESEEDANYFFELLNYAIAKKRY